MRLTGKTWATGIHGITGRPVEEGWLESGTLVRNLRMTGAVRWPEGEPWLQFDASTDGGKTWLTQQAVAPIDVSADEEDK